MKKMIFVIMAFQTGFLLFSCGGNQKENTSQQNIPTAATNKKTPSSFPLANQGKEIFEGAGTCTACHKLDSKVVGPSILEMAAIYKANKASIAAFLNEQSEPIVDPSQYSVMKANFAITKNMQPEERQALEQYIMSHAN